MSSNNYSFEDELLGIEREQDEVVNPVDNDNLAEQFVQTTDHIPNSLYFTPGLRIVACCGNCKYFWYESQRARRAYCTLPFPNEVKKRFDTNKEYKLRTLKKWFKRHVTNVCDRHQFQSNYYSFDRVSDWIGLKFEYTGSLAIESLSEDDMKNHPARLRHNAAVRLSKNS